MAMQRIVVDPLADFAAEVRAGLTRLPQRELPSKYFYDEVGSALFEAICVLPEYGLSRAGERLLRRHAEELPGLLPGTTMVAELGSGTGRKTRYVLEALSRRAPTTYYPIEISGAALAQSQQELSRIEDVSVVGLQREYLDGLTEAAGRREPRQCLLVLFLGSTLGNFERPAGEEFLRQVRAALQPGDALLLALDLEKPLRTMLLAYDDPAGVTAAFNKNLLCRINRELGANFDTSRFQHLARYDAATRRVEMHLRSETRQRVRIARARLSVELGQGETIWTESSHKYAPDEAEHLAAHSGFECRERWIDREWPFGHYLLEAV